MHDSLEQLVRSTTGTSGAKRGRWRATLIGAAVASLALTGCAGSNGSDAGEATTSASTQAANESAVEFPYTFQNADGTTTEIPEQPQNIASTSVTVTGALLSFGAPVKASGAAANGKFFPQWADEAAKANVETLWSAGKVDLEAVIAADPDLIVVASTGADSAIDNLADFQDIAPTIVVDYGGESWPWTEAQTLQEGTRDLLNPDNLHFKSIDAGLLPPSSLKPHRTDRRYLDDFRNDFRDVDSLFAQQQIYLDPRTRVMMSHLLDPVTLEESSNVGDLVARSGMAVSPCH